MLKNLIVQVKINEFAELKPLYYLNWCSKILMIIHSFLKYTHQILIIKIRYFIILTHGHGLTNALKFNTIQKNIKILIF